MRRRAASAVAAATAALACLLATPAASRQAAPADPMLAAFEAYCLAQPGRFAGAQAAAQADGWETAAPGTSPEFDRIAEFAGKLQEAAREQNFHVAWSAYVKQVGSRQLFLGFTDKRQGGRSERECTVTDFHAGAQVGEALMVQAVGGQPSQRSDMMGVRQAIWETPARYPTVAFIRSQHIGQESPLSQLLAGGAMLQMVTVIAVEA